jgi:hypothetical protein
MKLARLEAELKEKDGVIDNLRREVGLADKKIGLLPLGYHTITFI